MLDQVGCVHATLNLFQKHKRKQDQLWGVLARRLASTCALLDDEDVVKEAWLVVTS